MPLSSSSNVMYYSIDQQKLINSKQVSHKVIKLPDIRGEMVWQVAISSRPSPPKDKVFPFALLNVHLTLICIVYQIKSTSEMTFVLFLVPSFSACGFAMFLVEEKEKGKKPTKLSSSRTVPRNMLVVPYLRKNSINVRLGRDKFE